MKKDIHPEWYPDAKVIVDGKVVMTVGSTKPELSVEIWSGTHPFYTGQQRLVDTEGQVDRFLKRLQRREHLQTTDEVEAEEQEDPRELPIDAVEALDKRALNGLRTAGMETVGALVDSLAEGDDGLLAVNGIGQVALIEIKKYLRRQELIS